MAAHAVVGQLSFVPSAYAGRIHHKVIGYEPRVLLQFVFHDGLGRRRAADVAEAHEEDGDFSFTFHFFLPKSAGISPHCLVFQSKIGTLKA